MNLTISDKDLLLKPLQAASGIVERRHTLPILLNTLITEKEGKLAFVTTDLEIETEATSTIQKPGQMLETTVSVRKLQDILRSFPSETEVTLKKSDNRMQVICGKSCFNLQLLPAEDFPRMALEDEPCHVTFTLVQQVLKKQLQQITHAMAQQDLRYYLNGMLFLLDNSELTLVATDTHRLGMTAIPLDQEVEKHETIVPRKTIQELAKLLEDSEAPITIEMYPKKISFQFSGISLISKIIAGKFPDFKRVIPETRTFQFELNRLDFLHALQRTAIITSSSDLFRSVHLSISDRKIRIFAKNKEQEEAQEELDTNYADEIIEASFNIVYLIEVLSNLNGEIVQCSFENKESAVLITTTENQAYRHVLMPMRE